MQERRDTCRAEACIQGEGKLRGSVKFTRHRRGTLVEAEITGLPESESGFFAMHIHEGGSCCDMGFPDTGGHYNPGGAAHPAHAGDLPPLLSCGGYGYTAVLTDRFRVADIVGKTVVIHSGPDDFRSQPAGDAGRKIGCGLIKRI